MSQAPRTGDIGSEVESFVQTHLERHGLVTLARNVRFRQGEIDLVMRDGQGVAFVEVRFRRNRDFGGAAASVDRRKQARVIAAAHQFLQSRPDLGRLPCRFDVVAVEHENDDLRIEWIKNAFEVS